MVKIKHEKVLKLLGYIEDIEETYSECVENLAVIKDELIKAIDEDKDIDNDHKRMYIDDIKNLNPEHPTQFFAILRLFKYILDFGMGL